MKTLYQIWDLNPAGTRNGIPFVLGCRKTLRAATRRADKLNLEYGAERYTVRPVSGFASPAYQRGLGR
jgi:hypothetical protein